jgi:hypothetical protein
MSDSEEIYCRVCESCGEDGCCSALNCRHSADGMYCKSYLKDLKFSYILSRELLKLIDQHKDIELNKKLDEVYSNIWDEVYTKKMLDNETNS